MAFNSYERTLTQYFVYTFFISVKQNYLYETFNEHGDEQEKNSTKTEEKHGALYEQARDYFSLYGPHP